MADRILLTAIISIALASVCLGAEPKDRPNILIFMADDQYRSSIGCYGATPSHTPNIDRLAQEGLRFTQCFTPSSICTPNRAAFLSGMLPLKNGAHAVSARGVVRLREGSRRTDQSGRSGGIS